MTSLNNIVPAGVVTGDDLYNLFDHARTNGYAIPAVNCTRYARCKNWMNFQRFESIIIVLFADFFEYITIAALCERHLLHCIR